MKKNLKRTLAKVMAVALTVSLLGTAADADAAKKIKLAKKTVTVTKGKSKKVKIKNVKAKQVKEITVKQTKKAKKIAKVTKSGKTAVKAKGLKKGTAKATIKVTLKNKKKVSLKLTVKVKAATPKTPSTPAPSANPSTNPSANPSTNPSANPSADPGTNPDGTTKPDDTAKPDDTTKPDGTEKPPIVAKDITLIYDNYKFDNAVRIPFSAAKEGYPEEGIDVSQYGTVTVKMASERAVQLVGDWAGKVGLSTTNTDIIDYATTDGFFNRFFNDVEKQGGYKDGVYTIEYKIDKENLTNKKIFTMEHVRDYVDCINVQLNTSDDINSYDMLALQSIEFRLPDGKEDPKEPTASLKLGKKSIAIGETTSVEVAVENAEVQSVEWSADTSKVEITKANVETAAVVTAIAATESVEIKATVTTKDGKTLEATTAIKVTETPEAPGEELELSKKYVADLSNVEISDVKDAAGAAATKMAFSANYQRVFFDVSDIDFTKVASIKVKMLNPGKISINLWDKALSADKVKDEPDDWWRPMDGSSNGDNDVPGYSNGETYRDAAEEVTTYQFDLVGNAAEKFSKLVPEKFADIKYLSIGTNQSVSALLNPYEEDFLVYGIEIVEKEATVTAVASKSEFEAEETATITPTTKLAGDVVTEGVTYKYTSSDETVATVSNEGVVTGVAAGDVTITVEATVAGITKKATATVDITVKAKSVVPSVELAIPAGIEEVVIGTGLTADLDLTVRNTGDAAVEFEYGSEDDGTATAVASADKTKVTVTGTKAGTVTVVAKVTVDGEEYKSEAVEVTVADPTVAVKSTTIARVLEGKTIKLEATTTNAGDDAEVSYTSSDEEVATVDDEGVVTGVAAGSTATITATITVAGQTYTGEIEITVAEAPEEDIDVDLSAAVGVAGMGSTDVPATKDASATSITYTTVSKYNNGIVVEVEIPDGADLSDYAAISCKATTSLEATEDGTYKQVVVGVQQKGNALSGPSDTNAGFINVEIFKTSWSNVEKPVTASGALDLSNFANAVSTTGTVKLSIGINDLPIGTEVTISDVKLLKEAPQA